MLNLPIESEIETEHKVIRDFNVRQVISILIAAVIVLIFYLYVGRDVLFTMGFAFPVGAVAAFFAKPSDAGLPAEKIILKKLQIYFYKSEMRKYRTRNMYMPVINDAYKSLKNKDNTKQIRKEIRKAEKMCRKRLKKSPYKALY
ncbi:MAG: PrgI family protein [Butyrivibrio sp.]|nr:PrgI family protein [Butyrivibrio sp.]